MLVKKGKAEIDLFAMGKTLMGPWTLNEGDLILLVSGKHGIRCLEDMALLEIKQGPYTGIVEKEHF